MTTEHVPELIFATTNADKLAQVKGALAPLPIMLVGLEGIEGLPEVAETGRTGAENAHLKAVAYASAAGKAVMSMDNSLRFAGLPDGLQPGTHVRRIPGSTAERPSDDEVLAYYAGLVRRLGEPAQAWWDFDVCIAEPDGTTWATRIVSERRFIATPSEGASNGYPLERIQVDPVSGKTIASMTAAEQAAFWQGAIGDGLQGFVRGYFAKQLGLI